MRKNIKQYIKHMLSFWLIWCTCCSIEILITKDIATFIFGMLIGVMAAIATLLMFVIAELLKNLLKKEH